MSELQQLALAYGLGFLSGMAASFIAFMGLIAFAMWWADHVFRLEAGQPDEP